MRKPVKGIALWKKAKKRIPGGTQLLSKRSEMFLPELWPSYFTKANGIHVWDLDGNRYRDMSTMSVGSCILGYADPDVNRAVKKAIDEGSTSTLNSPEEVELTELLCALHPWADMARYTRSGGEAMAVAVRIARAFTKKDAVAFCGYHGWHDWYLAANIADKKNLDGQLLPGLAPNGVPRALKGSALPFRYNAIEELNALAKTHSLGAIVMEPRREHEPDKGFLEQVRDIATRIGAVLIFDEVSSGWRVELGGIHKRYKVNPDIAVFSKAMSNGFPMGAIIGRRKVMDVAQETFISSTTWTERTGPVAALATIRKLQKHKVPDYVCALGNYIGQQWKRIADNHGIAIEVGNIPSVITFTFLHKDARILHTFFTQEMVTRGYLASKSVYVSFAHTKRNVNEYLTHADEVFSLIAKTIAQGRTGQILKGPVAHKGFTRLT